MVFPSSLSLSLSLGILAISRRPRSHFVTLFGLILFRDAYRRAKQASEIRPESLVARFIEKSAKSIAGE